MRRLLLHIALGGLLLGGRATAALSAWDETQLQLLQQYSTPLRWYNVEGAPYWVDGPKPRHHFGSGLDLIHLPPGETVTLRASANTWLRLAAEAQSLGPEDLEISVSIDARAFAVADPIRTSDPHLLLIALSQDKPSLVRLTRPRSAKAALVFAAFFSLEEPSDTLAPYRDEIRLPGKAVHLRRDDEAIWQSARLVQPKAGIEFVVEGPARVQLIARLPWPVAEPLREQALDLPLKLDGTNQPPLLLCPELDLRHRTRVHHSTELVSQRMNGYFSVPAGKHTVRLQPAIAVYLSAFRQDYPDLLFPSLNAPATNALQVLLSALNADRDHPAIASPTDARALADREQEAWRLARDNRPLDAGAQAADWLNRLAQTRRDYPEARQSVAALRRQRTFYREVLPAHQSADQPLHQNLFSTARLLDVFEPQRPVAVYNPTLEQVRELFVEGSFAPVAPSPAAALIYDLPLRSYDSELRIAALGSASARSHFFVQFDQQAPVKVMLDPNGAVSADELEPSTALATLRILEQRAHLATSPSAGRPVGDFDLPFPVAEPGMVELPLPQNISQVRIYQETSAPPVMASIAYRAAKPFEPGEANYLSLLSQSSPDEVLRILSAAQDTSPGVRTAALSEPSSQLQNYFLPLIRLLKADGRDVATSVDPGSVPEPAGPALPLPAAAKLRDTARNLEKDGQLIEAMEVWNQLFWQGAAADRMEAALAIMRNLQSLDEDFLATQYARYAVLKSPATRIPPSAIALLEDKARQADDPEQLEQLRAFLFTGCPCPEHLAGLIEAFALNSRDEMVLATGLLLPVGKRPKDDMLAAALHLNWWQTFDQLAESLPEPEAKSFWGAQKHLAFYQFVEAENDLKSAGPRGAPLLRALQDGKSIRERLAAPDLKERLAALFDWEQWQSHQPGPRTWQKAEDIVFQSSATELVFNREQNQFAEYFRAEPGQPVRLRFMGPLHLQIEVRPVLNLPFEKPVDDWLDISEHGITNRIPVNQCVPNASLQLASTTNALASLKTTADLEWGPGFHDVSVGLAGRIGLVRVQESQPILPLRILPSINIERLSQVLETGRPLPSIPGRLKQEREPWWMPADRSHPDALTSGTLKSKPPTAPGLDKIQNLRLALRLAASEPSPEFSAAELQALPLAEQWLAAGRWNRWNDFTNWNALPEMDRANYLLATHAIRPLLDSKAPHEINERLIALLRVAEESPAWRKEAQGLAEQLAAETNCPAGSKNILLRLTDDLTWVPLPISPSSAGIHPVDVLADLPQDPSSRVRRALLPPAGTNGFTLTAQSAFSASLALQHPAHVQVRAELAKAGFSPLLPLTVSLQIDALEIQHLPLLPLSPAIGTNFDLAEGPHLVRLWIEDPVANQFVRVRFAGDAEGITNSVWSQSFAEAASESRFFHTATATQPVRFSWKGPALLRLDEWREGRLLSQLRLVPTGDQDVEIQPATGRSESWYRIFIRASQTNQPDVRPALTAREPVDVPPPQLRLPASVPPSQARLTDYYRLGGQEDGTWTTGLMLAHRRPFELAPRSNSIVNEFVEANVAYRKQSPSEALWFATEGLARVHRPGDLTLGLNERIEGRPQVSLFDWAWSGEGFVGSTGPQQQNVEGSLYTTFELGPRFHPSRQFEFHPFAAVFAHYLSLTPGRAAQLSYIDQDLFTLFRYQHRWGLVLGSEFEYRPWLDTQLKAALDGTSNEDFSPDHWGGQLYWNQLFGAVRGEVGYRFTQYLADNDRRNSAIVQGVSVGVYAEHWLNGRHRLELGVQYRHEWPRARDSYFLVLNWDFSHGRGYQDYAPHEMSFRELRSRSIPAAFNNLFQPGPSGTSLP